MTLVAGMYGYSMYHTLLSGDMRAMQMLPLYILIGPFAVLTTRALNGAAQGNALYWLLNALFMFGLFGWNAWTVPLHTLNGLAVVALWGLFFYGMICLVTAWRRWHQRRDV